MIVFVQLYGKDNPQGFPKDYPKICTIPKVGDTLPAGYVSMEWEAYIALIDKNRAIVEQTLAAQENTVKSANTVKLDALKQLFDEGKIIEDAWTTATNAQKFELGRIAFKILLRTKRSILDEYRPE